MSKTQQKERSNMFFFGNVAIFCSRAQHRLKVTQRSKKDASNQNHSNRLPEVRSPRAYSKAAQMTAAMARSIKMAMKP